MGWQTVGWQEGCRMQGRSHLGGVPSCRSTHRARSTAASASSRQTKGGASRSQDAQTAGFQCAGEGHVHEVFCHVSHSGRYIRAPHAKRTSCMYHPAIAASGYTPLGSLYTPCPRPGQATAIAATLFVTASQRAWANKGFPARCLRALITTWQSRLVSSRQPGKPGDDGSNCQVKVGISTRDESNLKFSVPLPVLPVSILTCLAGAALVPVVVQSLGLKHNLWFSRFPLHYTGLLHLSHQVYHTMPSRPQNSPIISAIHSLPTPNLITRYLPPHRPLQPVFPAPSRLSTAPGNQQRSCSGLALFFHPRSGDPQPSQRLVLPTASLTLGRGACCRKDARMTGQLTSNELPIVQPDRKSTV